MCQSPYDLIVIGAGPGGYVAAIRAAQLGMRVACVEKQYLGGTCLNVGCIPSKALLDSSYRYSELRRGLGSRGIKVGDLQLDLPAMLGHKDQVVGTLTRGVGSLFRKNKIDHIRGVARLAAADSVEVDSAGGSVEILKTKRILIATGSAPAALRGIPFDGKYIVSSTEALAFPEVPKRLIVIGAGYIGLELGSVWSRLGSDVLVLEFLDRALAGIDKEMAGLLQRMLEKQGLKFHFNTKADSATVENDKVKLSWSSGQQRGSEEANRVLVAVGRKPVIDRLGLAEVGVATDAKSFIKVDASFATSIPGIFAIGDCIGGQMLAHKAEEEGIAAVELMAGQAGHVNYKAVPAVVYTHPELASVGLTEEEAGDRGIESNVGKFPFAANGRARCMDETEGMVKVVADARTDRLLGMQVLGPHASDLIAEAAMAMELAASAEDIGRTCHAHPTLLEAVKEAALAVGRRAIHI